MAGPQFTDGTTALNAASLNALAVAQSYLISGTTPGTSGTLTLTVPAQKAVVNPSASPAVYLAPTSTSLGVTASKDTYIDLTAGGTYTQVAVANGAAAPAVTADSLRLWKVVSGGSTITSVTLLAPTTPTSPSFASPTVSTLVAGPNVPGGAGANIGGVGTTWQQGDTVSHFLATSITCLGGHSLFLLCTFRYNHGAATVPECHFDLAVSPTSSAATTSVTGLTSGASYTSTSGLKAVQANYVGDVTVASIVANTTAGAHRIELWAAFASAPGGGTNVFVEGMSFLAMEL